METWRKGYTQETRHQYRALASINRSMDFITGLFSSSAESPGSPSREKIGGDDGAFLGKLIEILENPSRAENTPLELNANALEYVATFLDRSRDRKQPVRSCTLPVFSGVPCLDSRGSNVRPLPQQPLPSVLERRVHALERLLLQVRHLKVARSRSLRRVEFSPFACLQVYGSWYGSWYGSCTVAGTVRGPRGHTTPHSSITRAHRCCFFARAAFCVHYLWSQGA